MSKTIKKVLTILGAVLLATLLYVLCFWLLPAAVMGTILSVAQFTPDDIILHIHGFIVFIHVIVGSALIGLAIISMAHSAVKKIMKKLK